jgi:hypothetical protein
MKKALIFTLSILLFCAQPVRAEREVVVKNAKTGTTQAMEPKAPEKPFKGDGWLLVDDFEHEGLKNYLKGESGAWNLDPNDEENANANIEIADVSGPDGKPTKALKVTYDVDSQVTAQNG